MKNLLELKIIKIIPAVSLVLFLALPSGSAFGQTLKTSKALPAIYYLLLSEEFEKISKEEAARFLIQATYGATYEQIQLLTNSSYDRWLDRQFALPPSTLTDYMIGRDWTNKPTIPGSLVEPSVGNSLTSAWILHTTVAEDQLRHRMAFAWSQIFVVSTKLDGNVGAASRVFEHYYDVLIENAFVNFRDLLETVTLNGAMGEYLNMAGNSKASATVARADENFAREVMQLFTIGLWELKSDGTHVLDGQGNAIPTYDQATVEEFAKVFTGWDNAHLTTIQWNCGCNSPSALPMRAFPDFHDTTSKTLLDVPGFNPTLRANQTQEKDLKDALDILFNHPNVGPFIGKQLIQKLVTSNPSPAYVARISSVFNNNGKGVRGDMQAVVRAILTDTEARNGHKTNPTRFGKFKEPLIRATALWRALNLTKQTSTRGALEARFASPDLGQLPLSADTVFNFFQPDFSPPSVLSENGLLAPEAQLLDLESVVTMADFFYNMVQVNGREGQADTTNNLPLDPSSLHSLVSDDFLEPAELIDHLDLVLLAGAMPDEMRDVLLNLYDGGYIPLTKNQVVLDITQLIITSPLFYVQR